MLNLEQKKARLRERLRNSTPDALYRELKSFSNPNAELGISAAEFIGKDIFDRESIIWHSCNDALTAIIGDKDYSNSGLELYGEEVVRKKATHYEFSACNDEIYGFYGSNVFDEAA
ncbi:hypothetical protein ACEWBT_14095 [Vibrio parahaemolyticus]|uniref:hypothetical protein n=1 Tax=Vibrio harveyi group TaxID=717610 RepID=UPI00041A0B1D|nr:MULTISPECIES: hypothetical protein [Vibrio harveyi group]EGQ7873532.1 hypothetical protein [Vibrio parahaemolyticus]EGQ9714859.1 hypothetical protein [Vibrio alginolyticus]EHK7404740.1 hypothetical protein [Vibrio parahaemolyticus]EKQ5901666.1 hypothetical protein [Vibrio parahaemolyticus]ELA8135946.1 hypothetical protein [Vibrio parahaemolyticus]